MDRWLGDKRTGLHIVAKRNFLFLWMEFNSYIQFVMTVMTKLFWGSIASVDRNFFCSAVCPYQHWSPCIISVHQVQRGLYQTIKWCGFEATIHCQEVPRLMHAGLPFRCRKDSTYNLSRSIKHMYVHE